MVTQEEGEIRCNRPPSNMSFFHVCVTFSFLAISQRWRDGQFPALSFAHVLQTLIPTSECFSDPKSEPYWILIPIFAAVKS